MSTLVKICGAVDETEIASIATAGADLVGLWYAIPDGPCELDRSAFCDLAAAARAQGGLEPVLVTFSSDVADLAATAKAAKVNWIQLHGYQSPSAVRQLRVSLPDARILKVLHIKNGLAVEQPFLGRYERAGVDGFLVDSLSDDGRVGSTGLSLDEEAALKVMDRVNVPVMIAGGLSARDDRTYVDVRSHDLFLGADFDTNARNESGRICDQAVSDIVVSWS